MDRMIEEEIRAYDPAPAQPCEATLSGGMTTCGGRSPGHWYESETGERMGSWHDCPECGNHFWVRL